MADSETDALKPDADPTDSAVLEADETVAEASSDADAPEDASKPPRRLSFSVSPRGLLIGLLIIVLAGAVGTFAWLYVDARGELDKQALQAENYAHAEKTALDYAVNAAAMDFRDLNAWKARLVAGTSPELNQKLTEAAQSMEQILVPLEWISSAQPLVAKVRSHNDGVYVVDCFVSVQTKTVQAADPLQSTATYSVVLDSDNNWQITDVGGIGAVVGEK